MAVGGAVAVALYARQRIAAIEYVRRGRGSVSFVEGGQAWHIPEWLRPVTSIVAREQACDLRRFAALNEAEALELHGVDDAGFEPVGRFRQLTSLWLHQTQLTAQGMRSLKGCRHLENLAIRTSPAGDQLLEPLTELRLSILVLGDMPVTDHGLAEVGKISSLRGLHSVG